MAYSITQARTLLTAAELELFDQSRADAIKALTLARLRGKVTRVRTLRDKYRDLFRRQTVAVRGASSTQGRSPVGADNERTQRKADILQEVLGRFEARVTQLEAREERESQNSSAVASKRSPPKAAAQKPVAEKTPVKQAAKKSATSTATESAAKNASKTATKVPSPTTAVAGAASGNNPKSAGTKASAGKKPVGPAATADMPSASTAHPEPLQAAVLNQHATRSSKAPSDKAPTANGKAHAPLAHAPTDMVPAALRGNPLKQAPGQIAIHAHQGSAVRRAQGKRDSR
ncbi:MAG: hypothetical protein Q8N13_17150 [Acidovorax sp.]|nr:hypothetical protein [Acidovorax sp.]